METSIFRVLVVDDYEPWRAFVASTLKNQSKLRIIDEARDGLEAVQIAQQLQPDLILLDIGLPTLNGIEAARRIREVSPKSKILFVSDNRSWDIAEEGLRIGAIGYVVKSDAGAELLPALKAALEGRRFLSASLAGRNAVDSSNESNLEDFYLQQTAAPTPVEVDVRPHSHDAVFYSDDRMLLHNVTRFIGAALKAGSSAIVVATASHRESLLSSLQAYAEDLGAAIEQGRYISRDAAETSLPSSSTASSIRHGSWMSSATSFRERERLQRRATPALLFSGEGAHILWKRGNAQAAIQDERLCNRLVEMYDVDMLCGYSLVGVDEGIDSDIVQHIREQHSAAYIV